MLDCPLQLQCIRFYTNVLTILNGNNSKVQLPACLLLEDQVEKVEGHEVEVEKRRSWRKGRKRWLMGRKEGGEGGGRIISQTSNQDLTSLFFFLTGPVRHHIHKQ